MFFFTKSQPKVDQPIETMIFSTEEDPDGVIIKTSLLHSTAEEPNEVENDNSQNPSLVEEDWGMDGKTHGFSFGTPMQADFEFERDTEDILYNDEREITDRVGAAIPSCAEEEEETETVFEGGNDSDDEDSENETDTPKDQETPEIETVNETEENPENAEDGDSRDKPVAGPKAAAAFWRHTDRNLAKLFSTCINQWFFLGSEEDQTFEIPADAKDLSATELLQFLESWDGSWVTEERATELCAMVLCFEDWRRERLEKLIRRELEDVGWEVESIAFDWNEDCDVLILNWKIVNIPKE